MIYEQIRLGEIRYNPETECFETLARIRVGQTDLTYPVEVKASLSADFDFIARALTARARRAHEAPQGSLRVSRPVPQFSPRETTVFRRHFGHYAA